MIISIKPVKFHCPINNVPEREYRGKGREEVLGNIIVVISVGKKSFFMIVVQIMTFTSYWTPIIECLSV